jgi:hypothetical protein
MDRLRGFLKQPGAFLLTCGFSFRDQHINEIILEALRGNPSATVFALMYGPLDNYFEAIQGGVRQANLSILGSDGAVIGTKRATWTETTGDDLRITPAIEWAPSNTPQRKSARFRLGDFDKLGEFIQDLIGSEATKGHGLAAQ